MPKKQKLLLIGSLPPPYHGANVYFEHLLESEIAKQFSVIHLDTSDHRDLENLSKLDFTNVYLALRSLARLVWILSVKTPDIVYVPISASALPYFRDGLFIFVARILSKATIIVHLHVGTFFRESFYEKVTPLFRLFISCTLKRVDTAIVLGNSLRYVFDGLVDHVVVVPNGLEFKSSLSKLDIVPRNNNEIIVGYLGNLFESKGVLDLLVAASLVLKSYQNVKFRFAGSWWDQEPQTKDSALAYIEEHTLKDKIEFVGVVLGENKDRFLIETDIFVFPSWMEGMPLVILEAMAAGCAVVSTRSVGAIDEVVIDGITGILVDKQNPQQIADAIIKLIENPELRKAMGNAGKERFERCYTMDQNVSRMIGVFNS